MAMYVASEVFYPAAAQVFAPIPSCTSELSSFSGIVCSGDAVTGKVAHCVLNEHFQAGLVCSEWRIISAGRCPRYITQYSGIDDFACNGNECPRVIYRSYEVYKYPACLNSSLYITEPTTTQTDATSKGITSTTTQTDATSKGITSTTTQADTTQQPSSCLDCADGSSTGQPMSCAAPVTIAVTFCVVLTWIYLLLLEHYTRKSALEVICGCLKKGTCNHSTTENVQVSNEETEPSVQSHFMTKPPSRAVAEQSQ